MDLAKFAFVILAVVAGAGIAVQFAVNSQLGKVLENPLAASVVSFVAGLSMLLVAALVFARKLPSPAVLRGAPGYVWYVGGMCGAVFVLMAIITTPKIGTAATLTFAILGQLTAALVIDQFGLFGNAAHQINAGRVGGALLVLIGAYLVRVL